MAHRTDESGAIQALHEAVDIYTFCMRGGSDGQG
jgi:hypothetical protein